jgi:hypothetical protein
VSEAARRYALLLYASEVEWQRRSEAERSALLRDQEAFAADLERGARFRASHALERTESATTIRVRGGRPLVTDGPFAETQEQLLGLYLVEAEDLDEAMAIAERAPDARLGAVEIRPLRATA